MSTPAPDQADQSADQQDHSSGWRVDVPLVGPVGWPPTGSLVYLATVGGLTAVGFLPWPVAGLLALGHVLARDHDHRVLQEIGEGLEDAE